MLGFVNYKSMKCMINIGLILHTSLENLLSVFCVATRSSWKTYHKLDRDLILLDLVHGDIYKCNDVLTINQEICVITFVV
uniref:Uncharacterized protein n=1 Tax=Kalanchoe fedtschenkoi TaxID=63787 RepID=A0A7N0R821_KALFE